MYYERLFSNGLEKRAMDDDTARVLAQIRGGAGGAVIGSGVPLVGAFVQDFANSMDSHFGVGHYVDDMHRAIRKSFVDQAIANGAASDLGKWSKGDLNILDNVMRAVRSTPSNELADNILKDSEVAGMNIPGALRDSANNYKGAVARLDAGFKKAKLLKVLAGILGVAGAGAGAYAGGKLHDKYSGNDFWSKVNGLAD